LILLLLMNKNSKNNWMILKKIWSIKLPKKSLMLQLQGQLSLTKVTSSSLKELSSRSHKMSMLIQKSWLIFRIKSINLHQKTAWRSLKMMMKTMITKFLKVKAQILERVQIWLMIFWTNSLIKMKKTPKLLENGCLWRY